MHLHALEVREKTITWPISAGHAVKGAGFVEDLVLDRHIGVHVNLGSLDGLVPEPNCDHRSIDAGLQQFHGHGVPKDMGGDSLLGDGRAHAFRCGGIFSQASHSGASDWVSR